MPKPRPSISQYNIVRTPREDHIFNYNYWTCAGTVFDRMMYRWHGQEARLRRVLEAIALNDIRWDRALTDSGVAPALEDVQLSGSGVSGPAGLHPYRRDLRGACIEGFTVKEVRHSLENSLLQYCRFSRCDIAGTPGQRYGTFIFFESDLSHSKFTDCTFKDVAFSWKACTNTVFYNCEFESVAFIGRGTDAAAAQTFLFQNCKFRNVDLSQADLNASAFFGNCDFGNVGFHWGLLTGFAPIGRDILAFAAEHDRSTWYHRRRIKSVTYRTERGGHKTVMENLHPSGEESLSRLKRHLSEVCTLEGMSKFYRYAMTAADASSNHDAYVRAHYLYRWTEDQAAILREGWTKKLSTLAARYMVGYGDRPERPLAVWLGGVCLLAFFLMFTGIEGGDTLVDRSPSFVPSEAISTLRDFGICMYFAIITSTTVGYGDIHPANAFSMGLCALGAVFGLLMFTIFTVTFARRFFR